MPNPINANVRSKLYIASFCIGMLAVIVPAASTALHWSDEWTQFAIVLVGAITALTSTLARANLDQPDTTIKQLPDTETSAKRELEDS